MAVFPKQSLPPTTEPIARQEHIASYSTSIKVLIFHEYKLKYVTKTQDLHYSQIRYHLEKNVCITCCSKENSLSRYNY